MAKRNIIADITLARGVALVRKGANQHAHVLLRKSAETPFDPTQPDEPEMSLKKILAFNALTDVAKAHVATMPEAEAEAFLEKSADEQAEILKAAGKTEPKKDEPKPGEVKKSAEVLAAEAVLAAHAAEVAKAAGGAAADLSKAADPTVADLVKSLPGMIADAVKPFADEIATLKSAGIETDLEKAANSADYRGYPGGAVEVLKELKAIADAPQSTQDAVKANLKKMASMSRAATGGLGLSVIPGGMTAGDDAISKKADELMKADSQLTRAAALEKAMTDDQALMKALEEEEQAGAA